MENGRKKNRRPAAVIFDMDGVLVDSEPFIIRAATEMFAEKGLAVKAPDFLPFTGSGEDRFLGGVAAKHGFSWNPEKDKARTYEIYLGLIRGRLQPLEGAAGFLDECRSRGLPLAVASSADRVKVEGNLAEIGLSASVFDVLVTGSEVRRKKPDPEIFLLAAGRLGCRPEEALVVEDAPNGVAAARAMGARCLGVTTSFSARRLREAGARWCVAHLGLVPPGVLEWED